MVYKAKLLLAWFKLISENEGAHRYSYVDIPYHFVFDDKRCKWKAKGATSWKDLRTVNGTVLETFREACVFKGLLQDDTKWQNTLSEAGLTQIRQLFSIILTFCEPDDPLHLWNTYKAFMMEDFIHHQVPFILAEQATLRQIEKIINQSGKTLSDYNLPVVNEFIDFNFENLNDNVQQSIDEANRIRPLLNVNQLNVSNAVPAALNKQPSVENQHSNLFFMDGPAGSGKTSSYNYLIAAWIGIAATLLTNESTLHGLLKLPVPILDNSTYYNIKRVILTPTNVGSLSINEEVLECLHGEVKTYLSAYQIDTDNPNEINNFSVEFFHSLTPSGMPTHCLKLKIGFVIMLLRNLDLKGGLCNGTRMKVCGLQNNYIDAEVLTGVSEGKRVFVPRIQLAPSNSNLPFVLKRRQFPVRLAYSMTINKSQGQTFDRVGVYLKKPCFSHGQQYVACTRTRAFNSLFFKIDKHPIQGMVGEKYYTINVIFSNVLSL
nr:uncharacterized protein LOC124816017 [Hydra vulgaris]